MGIISQKDIPVIWLSKLKDETIIQSAAGYIFRDKEGLFHPMGKTPAELTIKLFEMGRTDIMEDMSKDDIS